MYGYLRYLKSGHWMHLRKQKIEAENFLCQNCYTSEAESGCLHVHHLKYRNFRDCTLEDLMVLCENCHNALHKAMKYLNQAACSVSAVKTLLATWNLLSVDEKKQYRKEFRTRHKLERQQRKERRQLREFDAEDRQRHSLRREGHLAIKQTVQGGEGYTVLGISRLIEKLQEILSRHTV